MKPALSYLLGLGSQVGSYSLKEAGGYPTLRGIMTWSINNDAMSSCGSTYEYAQVFEDVFQPLITASTSLNQEVLEIYPNPSSSYINVTGTSLVEVLDINGRILKSTTEHDIFIGDLADGVYFIKSNNLTQRFVKK